MHPVKTRRNRGGRRLVAGREEILAAARAIGVRDGWKAVTIRAVAGVLDYTAPLLYEHFKDKEDMLTQLAVEGHVCLEKVLASSLPSGNDGAILVMVERYWTFMLENTQVYRLMNGMDGAPIQREVVSKLAHSTFLVAGVAVKEWLSAQDSKHVDVAVVVDEIWALLHGMAMLYLDRSMPFDAQRAQKCVLKLLRGTAASYV